MAVAMLLATVTFAQGYPQKTLGAKTDKWVKVASKYNDSFFTTDEARRIGDNVLLYQQTTGGWPKNVKMQEPLDSAEKAAVAGEKTNVNESTIDNGATTTEIIYLARLYNATKERKYLDAFMDGMGYLFRSQYDNGGWPQFWPRPKGYYTHITYNDDAIYHVMTLLHDVLTGKSVFKGDLVTDEERSRVQTAYDKGIRCILDTQIRVDGRLTIWCQQHDFETLQPVLARSYELPAFGPIESANLMRLLFDLPEPDDEVIAALQGAMLWMDQHKIVGQRYVRIKKSEGGGSHLEADPEALPLWARYYSLQDGQPFFCGRDGVPYRSMSEIEPERRDGYSWYGSQPYKLYKKYKRWTTKYNVTPVIPFEGIE